MAAPEPLAPALLPLDAVEDESWRQPAHLSFDVRARVRDEPFHPHGAGWWKHPGHAKARVWDVTGPAPTMRYPRDEWLGYGGGLIVDKRFPDRPVRTLLPF